MGSNLDHYFHNIQGWSHFLQRAYAVILPKLPNPCHVVEVGVWAGRSTAFLAVELTNSGRGFQLHAVDWWKGCISIKDNYDYEYYHSREVAARDVYQEFVHNLAPYESQLHIHKTTSVRAARHFRDRSLDLVMIDDDHSYESATASIRAWLPKVRPGGIIMGDDHGTYPGVTRAVREQFGYNYTIIPADNPHGPCDIEPAHLGNDTLGGSWYVQVT